MLRYLRLAALVVAGVALSVCRSPESGRGKAQEAASHSPGEHRSTCDDLAPGAARPELGCFNIARVTGLRFRDSIVYWHLSTYPSRAEAEASRSDAGVVVEEAGKVWLNELGPRNQRPHGGQHVASIGPLLLPRAPVYTAVFSFAAMQPGQRSIVHTHPGPEGWYMLAGEQCLETSVGVFRGSTGQTVVAPANVPMELSITGNQLRQSLLVVIHDARKSRGARSEWRPTGACSG
jgi:quercetin dioxygenase-like cupin family protein